MNIYFAENRFYDAETGTWLSKDPARSGLNWYVYCDSNPGTYVDVLGLTSTRTTEYFNTMLGSGNKAESIMNSFVLGILAGVEKNTSDSLNSAIYMAWFVQSGLPWSPEYSQVFQSEAFQQYMEQNSPNRDAFYGGKVTSDIASTFAGAYAFIYGAYHAGSSAAGGTLLTVLSGGTGAPVTVPMALANVLVGVGVSTGGAVVATNSLGNLKDDLGKLQESKGDTGGEWNRMTSKESTEAAKKLGYEKTNYRTKNGEPVYYNSKDKTYISQDIGSGAGSGPHNGGVWKQAKSPEALNGKSTRMGTYDANLNRIGD